MGKREIVYSIECEQDELHLVKGSFATDDAEADRKLESEILARGNNGDVWAWCHVRVKATHPDGSVGYSPWLSGCSYADETDYRANSGYFSDQCAEARAELLKFEESSSPVIRTLKTRNGRVRVSAVTNAAVRLIAWDHSLSAQANHAAAARTFAAELGWAGQWIGGPEGKGYVFVCVD